MNIKNAESIKTWFNIQYVQNELINITIKLYNLM